MFMSKQSLGQNVNIGNNVKVGNGVRIQNNVSLYEGVEIEDNVFCGPSCVFTNVTTPKVHFSVHGIYADTLIKEGASLGANCTKEENGELTSDQFILRLSQE